MVEQTLQGPTGTQTAAAKGAVDPDVASVKLLLKLLDKASKTSRTYGPNNPVAQKFFQEFYTDLTARLAVLEVLTFVVQRSELYFRSEVVYQTEAQTENLAFKLYVDGIRELSLHKGLTQSDLASFLEALWGGYDSATSDEDIVTRLWEKNLTTVSFVTAEEVIKSFESADVLTPQTTATMNNPVSSLQEVNAAEKARQASEGAAGTGPRSRFQSNLAGYEVSPQELEKLAKEMEAESARDDTTYILDMLTVILASEKSPALLASLVDVFGEILETLAKHGNWPMIHHVAGLLEEAQELCPHLPEEHKKKLYGLFDALGRPEQIKAVEAVLNKDPNVKTEGLLAFLLQLKPQAVPALCTLLANLESQEHRAVVCEALSTLAKDSPEPLVRGLSDRRPHHVRNLISIIGKLNNPRLAEPLEKLVQHPDSQIRKEVVRALGALCPSGNGSKLIAFTNDAEETVRLSALKVLTTGQYTAPFSAWSPVITPKQFLDRSVAEHRLIFQAMRQTTGEDAVPYWHELVTQWLLTDSKNKQSIGVLAAEALGKVGTPAAIAALEAGQKRMNRAIRNACTTALASLAKQKRVKG
ncbi:MAG: HEAT repeat domain-containing protein [Nitrospiraceae bacterium]